MISAERLDDPLAVLALSRGRGFLSCQSPLASNRIIRLHLISLPKSSNNTLFGKNLLNFVRLRGNSREPVPSRATRRFQDQCWSPASPLSQMGLSGCNFPAPTPVVSLIKHRSEGRLASWTPKGLGARRPSRNSPQAAGLDSIRCQARFHCWIPSGGLITAHGRLQGPLKPVETTVGTDQSACLE